MKSTLLKIGRLILRTIMALIALWAILYVLLQWRNRDVSRPPFGYPSQNFIFAAHYLGFEPLVDLEPQVPARIKVFKKIVYKEIDSLQLALDIYQPLDIRKSRPLIVFIHGGSWNWGKRSDYHVYLLDFAKRGWITATVTYRLRKQAKFPAAAEDVKCAVKWIKNHADEFKIDAENIALVGGSAGAHLAMLTAFTAESGEFSQGCNSDGSPAVKALVDIYGPVDLTVDYAVSNKNVQKFLGGQYTEIPQIYDVASPGNYVTEKSPPTLILHGSIDTLVPVEQAELLVSLLQEKGVPVEYYPLPGWPHAMDLALHPNRYMQNRMTQFFKKYIPIAESEFVEK